MNSTRNKKNKNKFRNLTNQLNQFKYLYLRWNKNNDV